MRVASWSFVAVSAFVIGVTLFKLSALVAG